MKFLFIVLLLILGLIGFIAHDVYSKYQYGKTVALIRGHAKIVAKKIKNGEKVGSLNIRDSWGTQIELTACDKDFQIVSLSFNRKRGGYGKNRDISARIRKNDGAIVLDYNKKNYEPDRIMIELVLRSKVQKGKWILLGYFRGCDTRFLWISSVG